MVLLCLEMNRSQLVRRVAKEQNMIKKYMKFLRDCRGVAAIEAAFIFPFLLLLFIGLIDLTGLISINRKVTYASSVMVDLVTQHETTMTKNEVSAYFDAVNLVLKPRAATEIKIDVYGFRKTSPTAVAQIWKTSSTSGPSCGGAPSTTDMTKLMTSDNDIIVARVCTNYKPWIATFLGHSFVGGTQVLVSETTSQRPRSSKLLACTTTAGGTTACS